MENKGSILLVDDNINLCKTMGLVLKRKGFEVMSAEEGPQAIELIKELTSGQKITTLKFTADYVLSERFNLQVYYDRTVNSPYISTSYPTKTSDFGVSFRFSLTQ